MNFWDMHKQSVLRAAKVVGFGAAFLAVVFVAAKMLQPTKARAEGISNGSSVAGPLSTLGSGTFSGCGVGVSGSGVAGQASADAIPINIGSNGQLLSGVLSCDLQAGQVVVGGAVEYGMLLGDLSDLGFDTDLTIRGRAGFVIAPNTLLFGHVGWSRVQGDGFDLDGWKFGPGVSINVPNSRLFVDFRYDYGVWDSPASGVDLTSHAGVVSLTYKFGK